MEISIQSLLEGAKRTTGSVAIIDVLRAFTTAAVAPANGASAIVRVRSIEEAVALHEAGSARSAWAKFRAGHHRDSISGILRSRSWRSISAE
jgi:phosphosulfolactate phosphohydrolase-like enzyme